MAFKYRLKGWTLKRQWIVWHRVRSQGWEVEREALRPEGERKENRR